MGPEAAEPMKETPMYSLYAGVAPRPEDWPVLLSKVGELLRQDYDWSASVAELEMPVMIVVGDADSIPPAHAAEFFGLLGGGESDAGWEGSGRPESRLAILPGTTHYDIFYSPAMASAISPSPDCRPGTCTRCSGGWPRRRPTPARSRMPRPPACSPSSARWPGSCPASSTRPLRARDELDS